MVLNHLYRYIVVLVIILNIPTKITAQINFQDLNIETAEKIISKAQSPYLIYFSGEWCPSCKMMEATTFKDEKLAHRINNNYLSFKVDVDKATSKDWVETYAVYTLPTTLIYNQKGKLLKRINTSITASQFLEVTTNLENPSFLSAAKRNQPIKNKVKKALVPAEYQSPKANIPLNPTSTNNQALIKAKKIIGYLNLENPIQNGRQYIVELGKYKNARTVERLVQLIRGSVNYPIKVLIKKEGNTTIQTIYLGEFETQKVAMQANQALKKINRKGVVKKF